MYGVQIRFAYSDPKEKNDSLRMEMGSGRLHHVINAHGVR